MYSLVQLLAVGVFEGRMGSKYRIMTDQGPLHLDKNDELWKTLTIKDGLF
jgi:hypothetical protein